MEWLPIGAEAFGSGFAKEDSKKEVPPEGFESVLIPPLRMLLKSSFETTVSSFSSTDCWISSAVTKPLS